MKIAVLIPCFNEAKTIGKVISEFKSVLPEADFFVYDNNSRDGTDDIARKAGATVRYEYRQGKGNVIRSMFRQINADCYLMIDGDDTYPCESAREMVDLVLDGKADMAIGDRLSSTYFQENKRPFHNMGNALVRLLVNFIFKGNVKDIMTGYRAFSYSYVKTFPVLSRGFEIETEMTIHALENNLLINSVPVAYRDRPEGSESKLNTFSDGFRVLRTTFLLFKDCRPLLFFSIIALVFFLIGIVMFLPVLVEYAQTGIVPRFPTLIASCTILMLSALAEVCGLVLDTVAKKHKQLFEMQLNLLTILHQFSEERIREKTAE